MVVSNDAAGAGAADAAPPSSESFFGGLVRRLVELVSPPEIDVEKVGIVEALSRALGAMKLTNNAVENVVGTRRGRPVRYDADTKNVVVNVNHAVVRALGEQGIVYLLAAAVSEINRELEAVTDAEELAIVRDLLRETDR